MKRTRYDRGCTGKQRHSRWSHAQRELRSAIDRGVRNLNIYQCRRCGCFHVGHRMVDRRDAA